MLDRLVTFEREIRAMFKKTLELAFQGHPETHYACVTIDHPDLLQDIIITLRPINTITEDTILDYTDGENLQAIHPFRLKFSILCLCDQ